MIVNVEVGFNCSPDTSNLEIALFNCFSGTLNLEDDFELV